ncbi:MAG: family 16 glycosylhydrolase, partial [Chitinophagales bacterium]
RIDNSVVSNGTLKIIAKKETFTDQGQTKQYTSARLNSRFAFKYGKVEVRAKLPTGVGTWPAIWMLGKNINEDGGYWDNNGFGTTDWPACGETDIMEHWGSNQNYVQSALHTPSSYGGTVNLGGQVIPTASTDFHVYALEWSPDKMVFSVDGVVHYTYDPAVKDASTWPFDAEQYLLLNVALQSSIAPTFTQSSMEIDYVRVYQACPLSALEKGNPQPLIYYPNPIDDELTIVLSDVGQENINLNIYNLDGQLMKSYNQLADCHRFTLDNLGFLPNGMYIISLRFNHRGYNFKVYKN